MKRCEDWPRPISVSARKFGNRSQTKRKFKNKKKKTKKKQDTTKIERILTRVEWRCLHVLAVVRYVWSDSDSVNHSHPLDRNISMHILHNFLKTFPKVLTRRICLNIKSFFSWWSFLLISWPWCVIRGWYCKEKLDVGHSKGSRVKRCSVLWARSWKKKLRNLLSFIVNVWRYNQA